MFWQRSQIATKTLVDLYLERDKLSRYWSVSANASIWLVLVGFIIFPSALHKDLAVEVNPANLRITAICLLGFGWLSSAALLWRIGNLPFQLDSILVPGFTASCVGFINIVYNIAITKNDEWDGPPVIALILSIISLLLYGIIGLFTSRRIYKMRERDARFKRRSELGAAAFQEDIQLLPEEEKTRQQLLTLLLSGKDQQAPRTSETFHIDIPEGRMPVEGEAQLPHRPPSIYGERPRSRSGTQPQTSPIERLSPYPVPIVRYPQSPRSPTSPQTQTSASFERPGSRQERQQEIEQGSLPEARDGPRTVARIQRVQTDGWGASHQG